MKFSFKFSNLLGTVYRKGNVAFTNDGQTLLSPVGNKVSAFDLKNNKTETLPLEINCNIVRIAISPNNNLMLLVDENCHAYLCSLVNRSIISSTNLHKQVNDAKFSPDGSMVAITEGTKLVVYECPGLTKTLHPFKIRHTFFCNADFVSLCWSHDSRRICGTCEDTSILIAESERRRAKVVRGNTYGHAGGFFLKNSYDIVVASTSGHARILNAEVTPTDKRDEDDTSVLDLYYHGQKKIDLSEKDAAKAINTTVTSVDFHSDTGVLLMGLSTGTFLLYEVPSFSHINSFSIGNQSISSVAINDTGDWLALACSQSGQLVVWEWQSETFILKQQGHFNSMVSVSYSPDGQYIATGGEDHKVKIWTAVTGFCFVTFNEHNGTVTGVTFSNNGKNIVSCSLDGTVRAFDLLRYRNFRTFTAVRETQFACLSVDPSGELICAGCKDVFDICVWSMKTGKLLQVLAGHESPVSSLAFHPNSSVLVSASWDKTLRVWDVFEGKGNRETIPLTADGTAVTYRPDGKEVAVTTIRRNIMFFNVEDAKHTGSIEAQGDLGYVYHQNDKVSAKRASVNSSFLCLCYSADGEAIIAGGQSPYVCIYSVKDERLLRRFKITQNLSLDGVSEMFSMKRFRDSSLNVDMTHFKDPGLPGVKSGDLSYRRDIPEVQVTSISFSPTGRAWAATTTEGVLVFSLDTSMTFDPYEFSMEVTPETLKQTLTEKNYTMAVIMSLRINQTAIVERTLECVPVDQIAVIIQSLPDRYVDRLVLLISQLLESTVHVQFYTRWALQVLSIHGPKLKVRSQRLMASLTSLQKSLTQRHEKLRKICEFNKYTMSYIISMKNLRDRCQQTNQEEAGAVPVEADFPSTTEREIKTEIRSPTKQPKKLTKRPKKKNRKAVESAMDIDTYESYKSQL